MLLVLCCGVVGVVCGGCNLYGVCLWVVLVWCIWCLRLCAVWCMICGVGCGVGCGAVLLLCLDGGMLFCLVVWLCCSGSLLLRLSVVICDC